VTRGEIEVGTRTEGVLDDKRPQSERRDGEEDGLILEASNSICAPHT
jgi:hypothetical protein